MRKFIIRGTNNGDEKTFTYEARDEVHACEQHESERPDWSIDLVELEPCGDGSASGDVS